LQKGSITSVSLSRVVDSSADTPADVAALVFAVEAGVFRLVVLRAVQTQPEIVVDPGMLMREAELARAMEVAAALALTRFGVVRVVVLADVALVLFHRSVLQTLLYLVE
jgi:hypothetical protein